MRYKFFKNAGEYVSEMSIGTWGLDKKLWGESDEKESIDAIRTAIDNGANLVDTAARYGDGYSEQVVGKALKDSYRNKVLLATKFGICADYSEGTMKLVKNASYGKVLQECDESLSRLDTDHIDIYFMHWPDLKTPAEETMSALNELKKQGKIRFIGLSNVNREFVVEAQKYAKIDVIQPPFSMVDRQEKEFMTWCESEGIASVTYGSLGGGVLTGAQRIMPDWPQTDIRKRFYDVYSEPKFTKIIELFITLDDIAHDHDKPVVQVVLNWTTQQKYVGSAICGFRSPKRAKQNCQTFEWSLSDDELVRISGEIERLGL